MLQILILLLSFGASLRLWDLHGLTSRELKIIEPLSRTYDYILLITYGDVNEKSVLSKYMLQSHCLLLYNPYRSNFIFTILAPFMIRRLVKKNYVIIAKTFQLYGCILGLLLKLIAGAKLIVRQGYVFTKFARYGGWRLAYVIGTVLEFISYQLGDYVIITTESDKKYIVKRYKVKPSKICVIPNWIDVAHFKPMNVHKEHGRIVFVGRLEKQKNILSLIEAVKKIPNVKLYIIGEGSLRKVIETKIKSENIHNVVLLGVVPNERLPEELNKSEIFILPSLWEGHPKALLEAMACGLPVIGSDVEGIRELIVNGVNGILCEPNAESIRKAILKLLNDPELRKKLGENARKFVVENFSFEKVMRRELALHIWLLKRSRKGG